MSNRKFYVEYLLNQNVVRERIRRWSDHNRNFFPEFSFRNTGAEFPTTHYIANILENQFNFQRIENNNEVLMRNLNFNID